MHCMLSLSKSCTLYLIQIELVNGHKFSMYADICLYSLHTEIRLTKTTQKVVLNMMLDFFQVQYVSKKSKFQFQKLCIKYVHIFYRKLICHFHLSHKIYRKNVNVCKNAAFIKLFFFFVHQSKDIFVCIHDMNFMLYTIL